MERDPAALQQSQSPHKPGGSQDASSLWCASVLLNMQTTPDQQPSDVKQLSQPYSMMLPPSMQSQQFPSFAGHPGLSPSHAMSLPAPSYMMPHEYRQHQHLSHPYLTHPSQYGTHPQSQLARHAVHQPQQQQAFSGYMPVAAHQQLAAGFPQPSPFLGSELAFPQYPHPSQLAMPQSMPAAPFQSQLAFPNEQVPPQAFLHRQAPGSLAGPIPQICVTDSNEDHMMHSDRRYSESYQHEEHHESKLLSPSLIGQPSRSAPVTPGHSPGHSPGASPHIRRRNNLPRSTTDHLRAWLMAHAEHPYPTEAEKLELAEKLNLSVNQICNWFINARRRILNPMKTQSKGQDPLGRSSSDMRLSTGASSARTSPMCSPYESADEVAADE